MYLPLGHSPDADLVADLEGRLLRVQVKTSNCFIKGRWSVTLCTRGGNQSWSGLVKRLDAARFDCLFILVGDGRRWCIPAEAVVASTGMLLGGPKYAHFEVETGTPLPPGTAQQAPLQSAPASQGGMPERPKGPDCKSGG